MLQYSGQCQCVCAFDGTSDFDSEIGTYRDLSRWKHPGIDQPDYNLIEVWLIEAIAIIPWKHRGIYQIIII